MRRPFRGLKTDPDPSYDAVIIGSGVGGLICGNLLAAEGLRVLLVEQHYMVGGYCSTFRRKKFTFDAATHFYPLLGNPESITGELLQRLGIRTGWVKMDPVDHFHFPDGSVFTVPADQDEYLALVKKEFPHQAKALDDFFEFVHEAYMLGLLYYFRGRRTKRLEQYIDLTLREVLDRYFDDRKLKLLLAADCPHWGSPPSRISFVFDSMLRLSYFLGNYYPEGGSQAFADECARRFEEQGGHIMTRTLARRVLLEDGAARGVEIELGSPNRRRIRTVKAGVVISNADLKFTLERLLRKDEVDPDYLDSIEGLKPSYPCFLVHIGLRGVSSEVLRKAQGYYWDGWDAEEVGTNSLKFKIFAPTLYEPKMAPPGDQVVIVQKVLDMDYEEMRDWPGHKKEVEDWILGEFEKVLPGALDQAVVVMSATAKTSERFTLNTAGAMLGWEMSPEQLGSLRPATAGPVPNLYLVGHWARPGGGITPVIVSAIQVAAAVIERRKAGV